MLGAKSIWRACVCNRSFTTKLDTLPPLRVICITHYKHSPIDVSMLPSISNARQKIEHSGDCELHLRMHFFALDKVGVLRSPRRRCFGTCARTGTNRSASTTIEYTRRGHLKWHARSPLPVLQTVESSVVPPNKSDRRCR